LGIRFGRLVRAELLALLSEELSSVASGDCPGSLGVMRELIAHSLRNHMHARTHQRLRAEDPRTLPRSATPCSFTVGTGTASLALPWGAPRTTNRACGPGLWRSRGRSALSCNGNAHLPQRAVQSHEFVLCASMSPACGAATTVFALSSGPLCGCELCTRHCWQRSATLSGQGLRSHRQNAEIDIRLRT
jgi:hypothetical protein